MISTGLDGLQGKVHDVCVIGAGPVGISLALELARLGRSVLLLESGSRDVSSEAQRLAEADIAVAKYHVPMDIAVQRGLGGTSNLWGGRCVPLYPIDFERREAVPHSGWPIGPSAVAPYMQGACDYLGCGEPLFEDPLPTVSLSDTDFHLDRLERWSTQPRLRVSLGRKLHDSRAIDLRLRATVTGLAFAADGRVKGIDVAGSGGNRVSISARAIVLAAGGLECTRLLLAAQAQDGNRFGGEGGPLGRYYMGHVYGTAAEMVIHSEALDAGMDYYQDRAGTYVRRRFMASAKLQHREALANAALWPDYPTMSDPRHLNGILSFAYLALSIPWIGRRIVVESIRRNYVGSGPIRRMPHMVNLLRDAPRTAGFIPGFIYNRYLARPRMPGFFQRNAARRYAVRFHAEHLPNPESRVKLTQHRDELGLPRLAIDLRYTEADVLPLLRTHECFAHWLAKTGLGSMTWSVPPEQRVSHIIDQCYDGHHQIGVTRMGANERDGVVGPDCRVFGADNLFVASTSVFRTSAAANPTLTAVALGLRLASMLANEVGGVAV